jgi:hypothetical protein
LRAVNVRHWHERLAGATCGIRDRLPVRTQRRDVRDLSRRQRRKILRGTGDAERRLDPVVPWSEIVVVDWPRECLTGTARVFEIVARESWNGAAPVIREPTRRHILEEHGFWIARHREIAGALRQRTMNACECHPADPDRQAAGRTGGSGLEQQDVDARFREQCGCSGGRGTTSGDDHEVAGGRNR